MNEWGIKNNSFKGSVTADTMRDQKLRRACKEFESIFTYEVLKSMRRTVEKCDLFHGGQGEEIYESLLDQELSKDIAGEGSGSLADQLYRQLKRAEGTENGTGREPDPAHSPAPGSNIFRKDPF